MSLISRGQGLRNLATSGFRKASEIEAQDVRQAQALEAAKEAQEGQTLGVDSFWVNFQRQTEFNPMHDHAGVYSFVIWMQIPTSFEEQRKLPITINSNASTQISNFSFTYVDILGKMKSFAYNMEKEAEGYMVLFPSSLHHLVNPFYDNDGERISISGNVSVV